MENHYIGEDTRASAESGSALAASAAQTQATSDLALRVQMAGAAVRDVSAVFATPAGESRNTAIAQALTSVGVALATFGFSGAQPWLAVAGTVIGAASVVWQHWDNWRAARANQRLVDSGAASLLTQNHEAIAAALAAAGTAQFSGGKRDACPTPISAPTRDSEAPKNRSVVLNVLLALGIAGGGILLAGCAHHAPLPAGNNARLIGHAEFGAAAVAAPGFVREALDTVTLLELDAREAALFGVDYSRAAASAEEWQRLHLAAPDAPAAAPAK